MGQKKLVVFTGDRINKGFLQERNLRLFFQAAKKSGRNNKVTVQGCCLRKFFGSLSGSWNKKLGAQATFLGAHWSAKLKFIRA